MAEKDPHPCPWYYCNLKIPPHTHTHTGLEWGKGQVAGLNPSHSTSQPRAEHLTQTRPRQECSPSSEPRVSPAHGRVKDPRPPAPPTLKLPWLPLHARVPLSGKTPGRGLRRPLPCVLLSLPGPELGCRTFPGRPCVPRVQSSFWERMWAGGEGRSLEPRRGAWGRAEDPRRGDPIAKAGPCFCAGSFQLRQRILFLL